MRIALLTLPEENSTETLIASKTRAQLQVEFAIALGCKRVLASTHNPDPSAFRLQQFCEDLGCKFQLIRDAKPLLATVKAEDQLLVIDQDIVPLSEKAASILATAPAVLALDADNANVERYERIDINHRWAGALIIPGRFVSQLEGVPSDAALPSILLRLALQNAVPIKLLPDAALLSGSWAAGDTNSLPTQLSESPDSGAGINSGLSGSIAHHLVARLGNEGSKRGITAKHLLAGTFALSVMGAATSIVSSVSAMLLIGFAWIFVKLIGAFENHTRTPFAGVKSSLLQPASVIVDLGLFVIVIMAQTAQNGVEQWPPILFAALALIASLRIGSGVLPSQLSSILTDRLPIALVLATFGPFLNTQNIAFAVAALLLLLSTVVIERKKGRQKTNKDNRELTHEE